MNIGDVAKATGISAKMIRYYEETGLIRAALRTYSGYRVYSENDVQTLRFVRRARDLGFTVKQIDDLLALWRDRDRASADVKQIALNHAAVLEKKMRELKEMAGTLRHLASNCHGDNRPDCPILTSLGKIEPEETLPQRRDRSKTRGFEAARVANHFKRSVWPACALNPPRVWTCARTGIRSPKIETSFAPSTS